MSILTVKPIKQSQTSPKDIMNTVIRSFNELTKELKSEAPVTESVKKLKYHKRR